MSGDIALQLDVHVCPGHCLAQLQSTPSSQTGAADVILGSKKVINNEKRKIPQPNKNLFNITSLYQLIIQDTNKTYLLKHRIIYRSKIYS